MRQTLLLETYVKPELPPGIKLLPDFLSCREQEEWLDECRRLVRAAPLARPRLPTGQPMQLEVTSWGGVGWWSDERGYRYLRRHPVTGAAWPPLPPTLRAAARAAARRCEIADFKPDTCLLNYYRPTGRLGLHQDLTERDLSRPIVTFSLGASALFAVGGMARKDPVRQYRTNSGDCWIMYGNGRLLFHGIGKLLPASSELPLREPEARISLTFRQAL